MQNSVSVACKLLLLWLPCVVANAEVTLQFRENPVCESSVVRLSDLVELVGGDQSTIERMWSAPLGPSPRVGAAQSWYASDIVQHLQLRGMSAQNIRWSGDKRTQIQRKQKALVSVGRNMAPAFVNDRLLAAAQANVSRALREYISLQTGERTQWQITTSFDPQYTKQLQSRYNILAIGGGSPDIIGKQEFILELRGKEQSTRIKVTADIQLPEMVVVASRPLRRDEVINAEALKLKVLPKEKLSGKNYYTDFSQVVGLQMRRGLSTGLPLTDSILGPPVVISRAQLVTVECASGGIVVKSSAKALSAGAVGDLIEVEMPGRVKTTGSVVDSMTVRVSAAATRSYR
ncbi:MAG: hypothetical protein Aurels2KO_36410 [Aureliella sp.]